ncbi:MAG: right-handed parallel beta-helix repeat-containing protein, partial [Rubripirellula sp.]
MQVRKLFSRVKSSRRVTSRVRRRLSRIESLENRRVLASFVVSTGVDAVNGACGASVCTLRDAVLAANASPGPDEITFAPSVTGTINLTAANGELLISDPVTITGPGAGTLTVRATTSAVNEFRLFDISSAAGDVSIAGLTLTGGRVENDFGGAIRFQSSGTLTIADSVISGNVAESGGAIYSEYDGTVRIVGSTIEDNEAVLGGGGAIQVIESPIVIEDSTFNNNQSYGSGGAISSFSAGPITISGSTLTNNRVTELGFNGGAIDSGDGDVTINNSIISGNSTAGGDGGGLYSISGEVSITASTLDDNTALYNGGAI